MVDLFNLMRVSPELYHPRASPEGETIAMLTETGEGMRLRELTAGTSEDRSIATGELPEENPYPLRYGPDGRWIYFHRDDGHREHSIYRVDGTTGDVEPVVSADGFCVLSDLGPDGSRLVYLHDHDGGREFVVTDLDTGAESRLPASATHPVRFAPDGERVAFDTHETGDTESVLRVGTVDDTDVVPTESRELRFVDWHPDGDRLLIADAGHATVRPGVVELPSGAVEWYGDDAHDETPVAFTPTGEVLVHRRRDASTVPVIASGDGSRELIGRDGVTEAPTFQGTTDGIFLDDDRLLLVHQDSFTRPQLLVVDRSDGSVTELLDTTPEGFDDRSLETVRYETYESVDGESVGGVLYLPARTPAPVVVDLHGGPATRADRRCDYEVLHALALVERGYAVYRPNYRGSTGYGRAFREAVRGDWGGIEQADIRQAGEWARRQPWADGSRVGLLGQSYGGFSVLFQLTTNAETWDAGVAWNGFDDLGSERIVGDADVPAERRPSNRLDGFEGPLLVVQGEHDYNYAEMENIVGSFRAAADRRVRFVTLDGVGHFSTDPAVVREAVDEIEEFFETAL